MASPTEFKLDSNTIYTLWNNQAATAPANVIITPAASQAVAVVWNGTDYKPVYFTDIEADDPAASAGGATGRPTGKSIGSNIFIVSLPGKKVRNDLGSELRAWLAPKLPPLPNDSKKRQREIARSTEIGRLIKAIEDNIGKSEITPKPAATAPAAQEPAPPAPPAQPTAAVAQPPERPASIIPAAREVLGRAEPPARGQAYVSGDDFDDQDLGTDAPDELPYTGRLKRDFHPDKGFTFVEPERPIPGVERDVFVHISNLPEGVILNGGARVRFSIRQNGDKWQVAEIEPFGMRRIPSQRADVERDPRSLPPIREQIADDTSYAEAYEGERDNRGKIRIPDAWYEPDFKVEIVAGGAPRPVRSDSGLSRRRGPENDEPGQS